MTAALMFALYAVLYHPHAPDSPPGRLLHWYLTEIARLSSICLNLLGERTSLRDATVLGRFSYVVVIDCAALDAQALFTAAVAAFPAASWKRVAGVLMGLPAILGLNVVRLVALYFAGATSLDLFHLLHEEIFVLLIILLVCLVFLGWASWARERPPIADAP